MNSSYCASVPVAGKVVEGPRCWWSPGRRADPAQGGSRGITYRRQARKAARGSPSSAEPPLYGREKRKRGQRKEKKIPTIGKICSNSPARALPPLLQEILSEFYKAKLPGEIHNLFLTSAAQLTNDSKAFSSVTSPTRCKEVGARGPLHICAAAPGLWLELATYSLSLAGSFLPFARVRAHMLCRSELHSS